MHVRDSLRALWRDFLERLPLILVGVVILLLTWCIEKLANAVVRRSVARARLRPSLGDLMVQLSTFFTWLIGVMVAAIVVFPGMTPAKLLTVLGLSSVALGFAFKDIFENFFAGILILWRFPFDKGDFVECNGLCGKVEDITIRMSLIRQVDGQLVVIPNAMLFKNPVNVITSQSLRRTTVICGVAYSEDVDQSRTVIEGAVRDCPTVADSKPVEIFAQEFADSSINFEVTWWTGSTPLEIRRSRDEVVAAVKRALDEAGIEIPFPYRTLTFKESLPLSGSVRGLTHETSEEH
jgi:small-conductance mechanosensitive channel